MKEQMSGIGDLDYERRRDDSVTDGIGFDTDGITDQCPLRGITTFDECERCPNYLGYEGFTVYCYGIEIEVDWDRTYW